MKFHNFYLVDPSIPLAADIAAGRGRVANKGQSRPSRRPLLAWIISSPDSSSSWRSRLTDYASTPPTARFCGNVQVHCNQSCGSGGLLPGIEPTASSVGGSDCSSCSKRPRRRRDHRFRCMLDRSPSSEVRARNLQQGCLRRKSPRTPQAQAPKRRPAGRTKNCCRFTKRYPLKSTSI